MRATTGLILVMVTGTLLGPLGPAAVAVSLPPDPENAALLYYQAFLLMPQPGDQGVTDLLAKVVNDGAAPNDKVKEYVKKCHNAIDYAMTASRLPRCDWGLAYSRVYALALPHLGQARSLARVILTEARMLADEGKYREALERCLVVYRVTGHLGDDVLISALVSAAVTAQANKSVTAILDRMPTDIGTLTWLKGELAAAQVATLAIEKSMTIEREVALEYLCPERLEDLIQALSLSNGISESGGMNEQEMRKAATPEGLKRAREYSSNYMNSVLAVLRSQTLYPEGYAKLRELAQKAEQDAAQDPAVRLVRAGVPATIKTYVVQAHHRADFNALKAAVDVYLARAATGRLPASLPADTPRDPYTGGEFKYEPKRNGFVLRCGVKDPDKNEVREYHFTTPK